jgi:hypothetical protein
MMELVRFLEAANFAGRVYASLNIKYSLIGSYGK